MTARRSNLKSTLGGLLALDIGNVNVCLFFLERGVGGGVRGCRKGAGILDLRVKMGDHFREMARPEHCNTINQCRLGRAFFRDKNFRKSGLFCALRK